MEDDGYEGPAVLIVGDERFALRAHLVGQFQPIDGRYRWYGRLDADEALTRLVGAGPTAVVLRTEEGHAEGQLGEPDLWNRYRIEGVSLPPFHVPFGLEDAGAQ
jgi:hypothetical protein